MLRRRALLTASAAALAMLAGSHAPHAQDDVARPAPAGGPLSPLMADTLAPLLADWIVQSRDAAVEQGVEPMPPSVREALAGYVPDSILDRVRWRSGGSGELTVQKNVFQFGDTPAVTLDHVIVFVDEPSGRTDAKLWAHEIKHVMQFADWGVPGFAERYLKDYAGVENEAAEFRWQWMKAKGLIPAPAGAGE